MTVSRRARRAPGLPQQAPAWQVEIDWSHPLARGLVGAWLFNGDANDITGNGNTAVPTSGASYGSSARGTRLNTGGSGYATVAHNFATSPEMTTVAFVTPAALNNSYNTIFSRASSNSSNFFFDLHVKSDGHLACYVQAAGSFNTISYDGSGTNVLTAGTSYCLGISYDSVRGLAGYVNGKLDGGAASGGQPLATGVAPYVAYIGTDVGNLTSRNTPGLFGPVYHYNRSLTPAEHAQLAAEPFCMVRSTSRRALGLASSTNVYTVTARGGSRSNAAAIGNANLLAAAGSRFRATGNVAPLGLTALTAASDVVPAARAGPRGLSAQAALSSAISRASNSATCGISVSAKSTSNSSGQGSLSGISYVAAAARTTAVAGGRAIATGLSAIAARTAARARSFGIPTALVASWARAGAITNGLSSPSSLAFVATAARAVAMSAGRTAAALKSVVAARAATRSTVRNQGNAVMALAGRSSALSAGRASLSGISFLATEARAGALSGGRAAARSGIAVAVAARSVSHGAAGAIARIAASAAAGSSATGRASLGAVAAVAAAARSGSVSAARAATSLFLSQRAQTTSRPHGLALASSNIWATARTAGIVAGSRATFSSASAMFAFARGRAVSAGRALAQVGPAALPTIVRSGRRVVARVLARLTQATVVRRASVAGVSMPFDPIRAGDTDVFAFDLSPWFPTPIVSGSVVVASQPAGWVFGDQAVSGSVVTVYATAPSTVGYCTLLCTASDGTDRVLTKEERILVVP